MTTKLIELEDGTLIEVKVHSESAKPISGGLADKVSKTFDMIQPTLIKICRPIISAWGKIDENADIEEAEVELGLSFESEGNIYITKSKASANITIKLVMKPKS